MFTGLDYYFDQVIPDANISKSLLKAEEQWNTSLKELRDIVFQQQQMFGASIDQTTQDLETQRELLGSRLDSEVGSQRDRFDALINTHQAMASDMKTFITNCETKAQRRRATLSTEIGQARAQNTSMDERIAST